MKKHVIHILESKLVLIDASFLPFEGAFTFLRVSEEEAIKGIQDAIDMKFLDNQVRSLQAAMHLSSLCKREILAEGRHNIKRGEAEVNIGDAALLCPHLSATRAEKRRHNI